MKIRIFFILILILFLNSCATNQVNSPAKILKIQELEEKIISQHLQKKLDPIEGIWQSTYGRNTRLEAFYKRGNDYIWVILENDGGGSVKKISEYNYSGKCKIPDLYSTIDANLKVLSTNDDTLDVTCFRKNYISQTDKTSKSISDIFSAGCWTCKEKKLEPKDYVLKGIYKRVWPEDLKLHNTKFDN
tara:strand:+ start:918 stop:1481 length:564 start_codon:yes stop_codon:yes gene_type:complete